MPPSHATATTLRRIHREIADLKKEDLGSIKLAPSEDDLFRWSATIPGPEGSVYEGGLFEVEIILGHDYPFSAPRVTFRTRIYHMNINDRGSICIDMLKHNWSPALSLFKVILSLSSLLTDPNPKDPLVPSIATEYVRNRVQHDHEARRWTELYARPNTRIAQDKGKGKASASPSLVPASTSSTRLSTVAQSRTSSRTTTPTNAEAITIDDSEDEAPSRPRKAKTRAAASTRIATEKRKRGVANETSVDIDLSTEDEVPHRPARRRRVAGSADGGADAARTDVGEVIVIED